MRRGVFAVYVAYLSVPFGYAAAVYALCFENPHPGVEFFGSGELAQGVLGMDVCAKGIGQDIDALPFNGVRITDCD